MNLEQLSDFLSQYRGGVSVEEGMALYRYAADCVGGSVVEIGSFRGKSAVALASGAALSRQMIYCVDPHSEFTGVYGGRFGPADRGAFYEVMLKTELYQNAALINLPSRAAARAWREPVGLLFVDGDHTYRGVRGDFEAWERYVCLGGIVSFDDAVDPAVGPARLIREILATGRYVEIDAVGKMRFLRKIAVDEIRPAAARLRILIACQHLFLAGGLFRFERFGRIARTLGHEMAYVRLSESDSAARSTEFPLLNLAAAAETEWDVTMVPGAGFSSEVVSAFKQLIQPQFGLRVQHVLNDQTRKVQFLEVNRAFLPRIVVFNNQEWPPGSFTEFYGSRFHVLEGGVDLEAFEPRKSVEFDRGFSPFVIGGLASKNPEPIIQACRELGCGFELRLFGIPGNLSESAEDLASRGILKFIGPLAEHELPQFYRDLDCVVHTETFAGWANLAAEALASGIPLICTKHGTRAFARDGETALVIDEPTPARLVATIRRLSTDSNLRRTLSANGRKAMAGFSWKSYTAQLLRLIEDPDRSIHYEWAPEFGLYGKWPLQKRMEGLDLLLDRCRGATVLDLGAADGLIARSFLEHGASLLHGVDIDTTRIARARAYCSAYPGARFCPGDLNDWEAFKRGFRELGQSQYDVVLCLGILQHLMPDRRTPCLIGAAMLTRTELAIRTPEAIFEQLDVTAVLSTLGFRLASSAVDSSEAEMGPLRCYRRGAP